MKKIISVVRSLTALPLNGETTQPFAHWRPLFGVPVRHFSAAMSESHELKEFMEYMENLKNYEKIGVPKDAGTDSDDGFDLDRMKRLLHILGNPHSKFKV